MRHFSALVWREIFERRLLLLASAVLGFVPVVAPWLPGRPDRFAPEELRLAVATALVLLFGGAALLILGSTIVGRDLSEGRLGFYLSRPISGWTLWLARLAAAGLLVVASVVLIAAPTAALHPQALGDTFASEGSARALPLLAIGMVHHDSWQALPPALSPAGLLAMVLGAAAALLALTHAASTIVRGRSVWVLADLAGLGAFAALVWSARNLLVREQALGALVWGERTLLPWILGALLLAGGVQITRGRIDLTRGHRYLSSTLWPVMIAGALLFGGWARFVVSSEPSDLESLTFAEASPNHDWLLAGGPVRHRAGARAAFLIDAGSDRSWRLGSLGVTAAWRAFSADGGTLAWARCESLTPWSCRVWTKDLRDADSPPEATEIPIRSLPGEVALSDDGSRLAVAIYNKVTVYELSSARLLAAVGAVDPQAPAFLSRDQLRFHELSEDDGERGFRIRQLDVASRRLVDTGRLPFGLRPRRDARLDVTYYPRPFSGQVGVFDGTTGRPVFVDADSPEPGRPVVGGFLADGRWIASRRVTAAGAEGELDRKQGHLTLQVLSPEGQELRRLEREGVSGLALGGEIVPGRVTVALREELSEPAPATPGAPAVEPIPGWTTYLLDAETAELTPLAAGVVPLGPPRSATGPRLFMTGDSVIRWDPNTGEHRTVVRVPGPRMVEVRSFL